MDKPEWKETYPYLLDAPLTEAMRIANKHGDKVLEKNLWDIFVSYRKSDAATMPEFRPEQALETSK